MYIFSSEDNTDVYFIAARTYSDICSCFVAFTSRRRSFSSCSGGKNGADRTFPIYLHIHIYIYFFFIPCFVSTLYSNVDSRSTKYLESKIRNCSFCATETFHLTNLSALRILTILSRVLAYLNSYKEIESCENSRQSSTDTLPVDERREF